MDYYYIPISKFIFYCWLVIAILLMLISFGALFIILLFPLYFWLINKKTKYYYNNDKLIVEKGLFNKSQNIVPIYRIVNITAIQNIFGYGKIFIKDKEQTIILINVQKPKDEMIKLIDVWEKAKKDNVRNEVI
jgi:hypothetical protein